MHRLDELTSFERNFAKAVDKNRRVDQRFGQVFVAVRVEEEKLGHLELDRFHQPLLGRGQQGGVAPAPPLGVIGQHFQVSAYPLFCLLDRHNCFFMFCHSPGSFLPACRLMIETRAAISPSVSFQYESGPSVGPSPYQAYRLPRRDGPALPFLSVAPGENLFLFQPLEQAGQLGFRARDLLL